MASAVIFICGHTPQTPPFRNKPQILHQDRVCGPQHAQPLTAGRPINRTEPRFGSARPVGPAWLCHFDDCSAIMSPILAAQPACPDACRCDASRRYVLPEDSLYLKNMAALWATHPLLAAAVEAAELTP